MEEQTNKPLLNDTIQNIFKSLYPEPIPKKATKDTKPKGKKGGKDD